MHVGCFHDKVLQGIDRAIRGSAARYANNPITMCYSKAKAAGNEYFAVQDSTQCFTSSDAGKTYNKYGAATGCTNGRGGSWRNTVYKITGNTVFPLMRN